jgi:hypothetical protein
LINPIIAIQGGLGNQLSQWYFAHALSQESHFRIDPLYKTTEVGLRNFELQPVLENCSHIKSENWQKFLFPVTKRYFRVLDSLWEISALRVLVEGLGYFREDPRFDQSQSSKSSKSIKYAKGYFQKQEEIEKVFNSVEKELVPVLQSAFATLDKRIKLGSNYTVIHVRRGDYEANVFTPVIIGTLSDDYYARALGEMETSNLVLLTENLEDVKELVKTLKPRLVLDKFDTTPWETLAIMYGASQFLGANSSLSWWGARLCYAHGGEVWLPSQWSYWKNIDPMDYHFKGAKIVNAYWVQG